MLKVEYFENRGSEDTPFGYVYFNDETRLGYAPGVEENQSTHGLFAANWGGNTPEHFRLAREFLTKQDY